MPPSNDRQCIARIDIPTIGGKEGDVDCVIVYRSDAGISLLVTGRYAGEAEIFLRTQDVEGRINALSKGIERT